MCTYALAGDDASAEHELRQSRAHHAPRGLTSPPMAKTAVLVLLVRWLPPSYRIEKLTALHSFAHARLHRS